MPRGKKFTAEQIIGKLRDEIIPRLKQWGVARIVVDYSGCGDSGGIDGISYFDAAGQPANMADFRHRALRHHSEDVYLLEKIFGVTITISTGRVLPVRFVGEQHVLEDLGRIPTVADWLARIQPEPWMLGRGKALIE